MGIDVCENRIEFDRVICGRVVAKWVGGVLNLAPIYNGSNITGY